MKKLTTITTQYSKFSDNQVLTKGQLNEFLDYFEDQDHLSRIALSGVGLVCGFKVTFNATSNKISISKGYGVTTDGDLLTLIEPKPFIEGETQEKGQQLIKEAFKTFTHFRVFEDNKANYTPFFYTGETQIELLEIFPEAEIDLPSGLFTSLSDLGGIEDKVVLLYLENYPKEGDLCTALDCDNQGIEQIARLRVLLVSSDDAVTIASQDSILTGHSVEDYLKLPEIAVLRDIFNAGNTKDYQSLKQRYFNLISNETVSNLGKSLDSILNKFNKAPISSGITSLFGMSPSAIPKDFQYRYDVLKDLVDTYAEIKNLLFHLNVLCCPSIGAFPKHLLLGRLNETEQQYKSLRHNFYKSPIVGHEDDNLQKVKSLLNRVDNLVANYLKESKGTEIKITPSQAHGNLSNKAIPFYYKVNTGLLNHWSYNKYKNFVQTSNLGYHTANLSSALAVKTPLLYSIDNFNFLRIEGVQGKSYRDALDQVIALKEKYGLSFDVKTLSVNATTKSINVNDYKCQFEDLSILLKAWRTEQNCILAEMSRFFSGFSTIEAGANVVGIREGYDRRIKELGKDIKVVREDPKNLEHTILGDSSNLGKSPTFSTSNEKTEAMKAVELGISYNLGKTNIVKDQLTIEDNTMGKILAFAIAEKEEGSANDILAKFNEGTKEVMALEIWKEEAPLAEFIFKDVAETLVYSYFLDKTIPTIITEIDDSTLSRYKLTIDELCKRIKGLQAKYQSTSIKEGSKQILGLLINQMSTICCSGKKLEILLEEIDDRKAAILSQIQLSEFVKKHPGLRHQAGVPVGGTFVMAYLTGNDTDKQTYEPVRMELGFVSQPNLENEEENKGSIKLWDDRASTDFVFLDVRKLREIRRLTKINRYTIVEIGETLKETVSNLAAFLNYTWKVAGFSEQCIASSKEEVLIIELIDQHIIKNENYIEFTDLGLFKKSIRGFNEFLKKNNRIYFNENEIITGNITEKNTVIADFALPYMCCSDCTPINFIVPKEPVFLSLPPEVICLEVEGTEVHTFTVSPKDGEVKAVVDEGVNGGVILNDKGIYQFDAHQLDPSLYGTAIKFTLNDEETTAVVTVYQSPQPIVKPLIDDFIYNNARTEVEAFFEVSGTGINANSVFDWDFGDNSPIVHDRPNSDGIVSHTYALPITPNNTVFPKLTVTNELCPYDVILEGIIFDDPVEATLDIQETYCLDTRGESTIEIPFSNISPKDGLIEIEGGDVDGMFINQDSQSLIITPGVFDKFNGRINFTISSLDTAAQITIFPIIQININQDPGGFFWDDAILKKNHFFGAGLPDEVDSDSLKYEWRINEVVVSNKELFDHQFTILEQDLNNQFNVELYIIDTNGCMARATTLVTVPYPTFSIELESKTYCTDDKEPHVIEVSPNFSGTEIEGLGVTKNRDNTFSFIPINSGIATSQSIDLRIKGTSALFTINLNSGPVANFTVEIIEGKLIITNTSDVGANSYNWNIAGEEFIRQNKLGFEFDVNRFEESVIDISLTVQGECGPNTFVRENITIRGEVVFDLELPEGIRDYCNNDANPYLITITPNIPGTVVEGNGVKRKEGGNFEFVPRDAGITSEGPVTISINGEQLLVVNIHQPEFFSIDWDREQSITRPETTKTIQFTASPNVPGAIYTWTFGDGTTATGVTFPKTYSIPNEHVDSFTSSVLLTVSGTLCDSEPIEDSVFIEIIQPDIAFALDENEVCYEAGTNAVVTGYTIGPNKTISVDNSGIFINTRTKSILLTSAFNRFNELIQFRINGTLNTSETLMVRRKPIGIDFDWSPKNSPLEDGQKTITITFETLNYSTDSYPNTSLTWLIDGDKFTEKKPVVPFDLPADAKEGDTFSVNAQLFVTGNICDEFKTENRKVTVILNNGEANSCNEIVEAGIKADGATIQNDPEPDNDIGSFIVQPTKNAFGTVIKEINAFVSGNKNGELDGLLTSAITATSQGLLKEADLERIPLFTKYIRVQIRLVIHILHCQEVLNESDIKVLDPLMNSIISALKNLQRKPFDVGDPDPKKLEGTLREFFNRCLENNALADYTRKKIQEMLSLITPPKVQ